MLVDGFLPLLRLEGPLRKTSLDDTWAELNSLTLITLKEVSD